MFNPNPSPRLPKSQITLQLFLTGYLHGDGDDGLQQMRWICLNKIPTRARRFKPRKLAMFDLNGVINLLTEEDVSQYQGLHPIKYSMDLQC